MTLESIQEQHKLHPFILAGNFTVEVFFKLEEDLEEDAPHLAQDLSAAVSSWDFEANAFDADEDEDEEDFMASFPAEADRSQQKDTGESMEFDDEADDYEEPPFYGCLNLHHWVSRSTIKDSKQLQKSVFVEVKITYTDEQKNPVFQHVFAGYADDEDEQALGADIMDASNLADTLRVKVYGHHRFVI